jgi:hypothetical protein
MAGAIAPVYKAGYNGKIKVDGVSNKVMGWKAKDNVETWDASSTEDGGWSRKERALRSTQFTFSMGVPAGGLPAFQVGEIYPVEFYIDASIAYQGNVLITDRSPNVDIKGGVTLDVTADNSGPMEVGAVVSGGGGS